MTVTSATRNLFIFDNSMGYKYGTFLWSFFWAVQISGLMSDHTEGVQRNYLVSGAASSLLTFMYFAHTQTRGLPASTASIVCMLPECLFRLLLAAYYGLDNVVGSGTVGGVNWFTFVSSCIFGFMKFLQVIYANFNWEEYKEYETEVVEI
jgi:hypothetical protein